MALRRVRGLLLRLARRRAVAFVVGGAMVAVAGWFEFVSRYDAWWIEGLSLIVGATGVALLLTGLTGVTPDWIE